VKSSSTVKAAANTEGRTAGAGLGREHVGISKEATDLVNRVCWGSVEFVLQCFRGQLECYMFWSGDNEGKFSTLEPLSLPSRDRLWR
jgi:hypothetical protein